MIGLYDWDLLKWRSPVVFNLELMKMATYFKVYERQITQMVRDLNEVERYNKVYLRKDYEDFYYPPEVMKNERIVCGGYAFTNGLYLPLNQKIESCIPDTSIYKKYNFIYDVSPKLRKVFQYLMNGYHVRIQNDDVDFTKGDKSVRYLIIHDKDLIFNDYVKRQISKVRSINYKSKLRIGTKYPVDIYAHEDFKFWINLEKIPFLNCTNIYIKLQDKDLIMKVGNQQEINFIIKDVPLNFKEDLYSYLLQSHYLAEKGAVVKIHVDKNCTISDDWVNFIKFYNHYLYDVYYRRYHLIYTPYRYCKVRDTFLTREEKYDMFNFIKANDEKIYNLLFNMEYTAFDSNKKLMPHMYTPLEIDQKGGYYDSKRNFESDSEEQFNYASITEPQRIYIEQRSFRTSEREQKITNPMW